jgi:hypothetical protein
MVIDPVSIGCAVSIFYRPAFNPAERRGGFLHPLQFVV